MDDELTGRIQNRIAEINDKLDELKWQKHLSELPTGFIGGGDPRTGLLMELGWLLSDLTDIQWGGFIAKDIVEILKNVASTIEEYAERH